VAPTRHYRSHSDVACSTSVQLIPQTHKHVIREPFVTVHIRHERFLTQTVFVYEHFNYKLLPENAQYVCI
jgi:hypothetical protein